MFSIQSFTGRLYPWFSIRTLVFFYKPHLTHTHPFHRLYFNTLSVTKHYQGKKPISHVSPTNNATFSSTQRSIPCNAGNHTSRVPITRTAPLLIRSWYSWHAQACTHQIYDMAASRELQGRQEKLPSSHGFPDALALGGSEREY